MASVTSDVVRLPYRPPLHAPALIDFLARRAVPGVEEVAGDTYRRTFRAGATAGSVEMALDEAHGELVLRASPTPPPAVIGAARRLFDLDADPGAVAVVLSGDPVLAPLVAGAPGIRVPGAWDGFELVVRAVLGQQVSVAAARTLLGRLASLAGPALASPPPGRPTLRSHGAALSGEAGADVDSTAQPSVDATFRGDSITIRGGAGA
jgi:AraC family transcriptional regulator of adaptative response / DNA-3-methyladenine glycosylase II